MVVAKDEELKALLDQYVCIRMVQINDLDLAKLQFDFNITWFAFFMNGDGAIYGRYGTRAYEDRKTGNDAFDGTPANMTMKGLKQTLQAGLDLHKEYVEDKTGTLKKSLEAKVGKPWPWKTPKAMMRATGGINRGCMHCHQITSNEIHYYRNEGKGIPDNVLWAYAMPDALGMVLDPYEQSTVKEVVKDSEAAKAGLLVGDKITQMEGQPILSVADVQWVLQTAEEGKELTLKVSRLQKDLDLVMDISEGWRRRGSFAWRTRALHELMSKLLRTISWEMDDVNPDDRKALGLQPGDLGIKVTRERTKTNSGKSFVKRADLIVGLEDIHPDAKRVKSASDLWAYIFRHKEQGSTLSLNIIRDGIRQTVDIEIGNRDK